MRLPYWVWLWVKCQHILSNGNLLGLSGTSPCRSHEVFPFHPGISHDFPSHSLTVQVSKVGYTLVASNTPCAPCWKSFSWLFCIAGQQTAGTSNYRNSYGLFALKSCAPVTRGLLFYTTNCSQFSSLLTHWFILNHIQWFQLVFVFMCYFFAFDSISEALCKRKLKTSAHEQYQDALTCLCSVPSPTEKQLIWTHENCQFCY